MAKIRKILVVDDEPDFLEIFKYDLERSGFIVITAGNGEVGLRKTREELPDLILLDLHMPIIDGFSMLRELKGDATTKGIPVILLSATSEIDEVHKAQEFGVKDYLTKPVEIQELLKYIKRYS
ncbi:MAG: response regulator [Candidatus Omnitrophota bacterium]|jgi:two-component system alkaline phosphatase synthesis response regulator PhoP